MASSNATPVSTATGAAPAWRQFQFFSQTAMRDHHSPSLGAPEILRQPALIASIHASSSNDLIGEDDDLVLLADLDGNVHVISPDYEVIRTWSAYGQGGRCSIMSTVKGWKGVVVTLGEDVASPFPLLKIWYLSRTPASPSSTPTLLRSARINPSSRPHPVSALTVVPGMSYIILGLADGTVVAFKHVDQLVEASLASAAGGSTINGAALGLGKLRTLHDGKEPITGLGCTRSSTASPMNGSSKKVPPTTSVTLFILTTSHVLSYPLLTSSSKASTTVLDGLGANVGCSAVIKMQSGEKMVVARDEAIYVYGPEGRENCYAYEGPKSSIRVLSSAISAVPTTSTRSTYLVIVSPPLAASAASASATIRNYARASAATATTNGGGNPTDVANVTIFDPENKFIAHSGTFEEGVRDVWEAYGAVWVLTEGGKLFRLSEQPLQTSLATLYGRNLYTLAISLAQSRKMNASEVAEIYRRYGDHLYGKSDFEGAMACYLKTVGSVQASYVIRKFLDAQRLSHLTSYLQELHSRGLANSDHTTLLLNCYTKLADDTALALFLHSSSSPSKQIIPSNDGAPTTTATNEPPFDLETAIRVCRQAGYFSHASWLASRYGAHQDYLRIQIEDVEDFAAALRYVRRLDPEIARDSLVRYGKSLLGKEPAQTTDVLIELCCGTLKKEEKEEVKAEGKRESGKGYMSYLAYGTSADPAPPPPSTTATTAKEGRNNGDATRTREASTAIPGTPVTTSHRKAGNGHTLDDPSNGFASSPNPIDDANAPLLPSPRQFFAHFVDHSSEFIRFLETVAERRYGRKLVSTSWSSSTSEVLTEPQPLKAREVESIDARDEQAIWNTLLELYLSSEGDDEEEGMKKATTTQDELRLRAKALQLLRSREEIPYDETQALLVCSTRAFEPGLILMYEHLGLYEDIIRYWIDASSTTPSATSKVISSLRRYAASTSSRPRAPLYKMVLRHLTSSADVLSRHTQDVLDLLDEIDRDSILPPISVVQLLSRGGEGGASVGLVREYLKKRLSLEKQEIEADQALIESYRTESARKRKEIHELSDPSTPRIFQVTRCSACGGPLDLPAVHFMCRHSYHQRCLGENESSCPSCAQQHGVIREMRRANEAFAGRHEIFLAEVEESDEPEGGFRAIANAFSKGVMGVSAAVGE